METKEKVIALYKYIQELCALKYRVITDVDKQHWTRYLKDIPDASEYISLFYRDRVEEETDDNNTLLMVRKPNFQRCPEPPSILVEWLELGWDRFTNEIKIKRILPEINLKNTVDEGEQKPEQFSGSEQRVKALEKWNDQRNNWIEKQRIIDRVRRFFAQLFEIYTDLERDSETLELMVGNGIMREADNNAINHPILLKKVKLQFDAKSNVISIHDTDSEPELYTLLLQEMREVNHNAVKQLKEDVREFFYHPLDRNDSPDFLKILTHRLCSDSRFIAGEKEKISSGDRLITTLNPVFFVRKRIDGTLKAIEEIIKNIEHTCYIPGHLLDLVAGGMVEIPEDNHELTIEEQLAASNGESLPILLAKEANREQLEIAERIEYYNAVLVQGPPGTGKTHTIANLLGHFLAQGKSVLVTSHTKKALSVLKEKVPDEIKDLCVSILDDTNLDMVRSVEGISEYMSRHTINELKKRVESNTRQRAAVIKQLAEIRKKIYTIKCREYETIVYNGESYSPAQAAAFVNVHKEKLSYIPGEVKLYHPLPVTPKQLVQLYRSNVELSETEEQELIYGLPSPDSLLSPLVFAEDLKQAVESQSAVDRIAAELNLQIDICLDNKAIHAKGVTAPLIQNPVPEKLRQLTQYIDSLKSMDGWMIQAATDGRKGGGYSQRWGVLIEAIEDTATFANAIATQMIGRGIEIRPEVSLVQLPLHLQKLINIFQKKGKISKLDLLFNRSLEVTLSGVSINGNPIAAEGDCILVQHHLTLEEKRKQTALLWNGLLAKQGTPEFSLLDNEPERIGMQIIPNIKRFLNWYQTEYTSLLQMVKEAGLNISAIFSESEMDSELTHTKKILGTAHKQLFRYIELADHLITLRDVMDRQAQAVQTLTEGERKRSSICNLLTNSIIGSEPEAYGNYYQQLSELYAKYRLKAVREETLALIEPVASEWADAIRNRVGIHGDMICPKTIEDAWKWKQFAGIISSIIAEPFEELQYKADLLGKELRKITTKVAADNAWHHLLLRTERNLSMRQALQGWKLTVKKIGKGTGKNAPAHKKRARELMAQCQVAVPAWIMTVNKAMESLDPACNVFDVIIIDEASQSDISALGIVYLAKKIIIVGDDKQVSPMAVGVDIDKMNALRDMYIKDMVPSWHLYDAKTSLYDIAGTTFQPLMLCEHFRCLPDIIGYSNKLSYDYRIKPLRDAGNTLVSPPVVNFRVGDGQREGRQKINPKEAEMIVALMMACMEQKEYDGMSFGVISLLGDEQAKKIQQIILEKIEPADIEQRHILCGNASHFQGDERDVIFLSLVDSNEGDGPLSMAGEGADQSRKQRYNVAASRARDQLWVVHSLDYTRDLKIGDLRHDLLEYAENPKAFSQLVEKVKAKAESPFEEAVGKALVASGYHLVQQWEVGAYRLDMVVLCKGNSIAVECDGESFHSGDEKVRSDMERQAILERIGWRFIRVRGSEYYSDPDKTLERVKCQLSDYGIFPETVLDEPMEQSQSALLDCVKIRAAQILDEWHRENDQPVADIFPQPSIAMITQQEAVTPTTMRTSNGLEQMTIDQPEPPIKLPERQEAGISTEKIEKPSSVSVIQKLQNSHPGSIRPKGTDVINSLKSAGIRYIDNRIQSGIIWVPFSQAHKKQTEKIISQCRLRCSFEKRGSIATGNQPAWRIMVG